MAGQTVQIAILADAGKAVSGFQGAGTAAVSASREFEKAGRAAEEMGEKFDGMASFSSQVSGGIGDIGGAFTAYSDQAKAAAAASDNMKAKQIAVKEAQDAYNAAVKEFGPNSIEAQKAQLAFNQAQRDAQPPTAIEEWGAKLEGMAPLVMGVTGAMDLLNASTKLLSISNLKNIATTTASRTAMVAGAVATGAVTAAQWALNVAMTANPIGLIIAAIVALVAVFVIAYKKSETFRKIVDAAWQGIKAASIAVFNFLKGFITAVWNGIKTYFTTVFNVYKTIFRTVWNAIKTTVTTVVNSVKTAITTAWNAVKTATTTAWNAIKNGVSTAVNAVGNTVRGIKDKVTGAISGAGTWLKDAGRRIIQGLIDGITGMIGSLRDKLSGITDLIPDWKGPAQRDAKLLYKSGKLIMGGLIGGIDDQTSDLKRTLGGVTSMIEGGVNPSMGVGTMSLSADALSARGGRGGSPINVTVNVAPGTDPAEVGRQLQKYLTAYATTYGR